MVWEAQPPLCQGRCPVGRQGASELSSRQGCSVGGQGRREIAEGDIKVAFNNTITPHGRYIFEDRYFG